MRIVNVPLGNRGYQIKIGRGLLASLGAECKKLRLGTHCAIVSDTNVARHYARDAQRSLARARFDSFLITLPAGETAKSMKTVAAAYDRLAAHRLERNSFIVALGGGVVGDVAGFLAATYLRGVAFVQMPTTLLAQVDSSVGGKVGVNLKAGKNLVGAFYQPKTGALRPRCTPDPAARANYRAGLAEVIKYGIIRDAALFRKIGTHHAQFVAS